MILELLVLVTAAQLAVSIPDSGGTGAAFEDNQVLVDGRRNSAELGSPASSTTTAKPSPAGQVIRDCTSVTQIAPTEDDPYGTYRSTCDGDGGGEIERTRVLYDSGATDGAAPVVVSQYELQRLGIDGGAVLIQPASGRALVHLPVIAYATARPQLLSTSVLGVPVEIWVRPVSYSWDFGGGSFTTTSPGSPYPNQNITWTYADLGTRTVRLTIRWSGSFQVDGDGVWHAIAGSAYTAASSPSFEVVEAPGRLSR